MIIDSIAAGLVLITVTIIIGIIWHLSRKIDHLQADVDDAQAAAIFVLQALEAHIDGRVIHIDTMPLRETEIEE